MNSDPSNHEPFQCEVEPRRDSAHVRPVGELDLATVPIVQAQLSELETAGFDNLVLDLRSVGFLDSTGLRMILLWGERSRANGLVFRLIPGPPAVQRLFDLTSTAEELDFVDP
jgi:anti-anti-sigma factor